jgi:2'-5' RNA ligase
MIRAFLAIDVPDSYRVGLAAVQDALKKSGADVKWVTPANIHLTLKFFGEITSAQVEAIAAAAGAIAAATPVLTLQAQSLGTFPGPKNPRVIWVGLAGQTEALGNLVQELEQAFAALGFPPENRPFTPHLTLGRVRSGRGREALCSLIQSLTLPPFQAFTMTQMVLYQSTLRPTGALYTPLQKITLRQGV